MSTKTTIKRIALVAVAALGFGTFTAIAPASATPSTVTSIVVGTVPTGRVDVTSAIPFTIYISGLTLNDTININAEITSAPLSGGAANAASALGSSYTSAGSDDNDSGGLFQLSKSSSSYTAMDGTNTQSDGRIAASRGSIVDTYQGATELSVASSVYDYEITAADVARGSVVGFVRINPDVTGTYTGLISASNFPGNGTYGDIRSAALNELYHPGDKSASFTFSTTGAPTALELATVAGGTIHAGSTYGTIVSVKLTGGTLGALDSIDLTASGTGLISTDVTSPSSGDYAATKSLTSTNFAGGQTAKFC